MSSIADLDLTERDGIPVARISGEIDLSVTAELETRLRGAVSADGPGLVLDLTELEYIDSAGLRVLVVLSSVLSDRAQELRLAVAEHSLVDSLLVQTGVNDLIMADRTADEAVAALGGNSG